MNVLKLFFSITVLLSCSSQDNQWKEELSKLDRSALYNNSTDGWKLRQKIPMTLTTEYTIEKVEMDTLKILYFGVAQKDENYIIEYRKRFPCGDGDTCYVNIDPNYDTLFFFMQKSGKKEFIVGEYSYRYIEGNLDPDEIPFFELYSDSLMKVRGNNLPKLPHVKN